MAELHWSRKWLINNKRNPDFVFGIEIGDIKNFIKYSKSSPYVVLHELAHGYHARVLTKEEGNELKKLYKSMMNKKLYDKVLHFNGNMRKAYASANHYEYFAESVVAYYGYGRYYPFARPELKKHDADMYAFLEKIFKPKKK